jgi:hypothetical protein
MCVMACSGILMVDETVSVATIRRPNKLTENMEHSDETVSGGTTAPGAITKPFSS